MKDRQNSKAQSDRTSSMESECSPDSRLIAQVNNNTEICGQDFVFTDVFCPVEMCLCRRMSVRPSAPYLSGRFQGSLCMTSWTRSSSLTSVYRRASSSSTLQSGRDRWGPSAMNSFHSFIHAVEKCGSCRAYMLAMLVSRTLLLEDTNAQIKCSLLVCTVAFFQPSLLLYPSPHGVPLISLCFCAVCSRVAPWTGPAHCVHLLRCRCSGCLQHHRYSHPEIVSHMCIHTPRMIDTSHWKVWCVCSDQSCRSCVIGCVLIMAPCQECQGAVAHLPKCSLSVNPFFQNQLVFSRKAEMRLSPSFPPGSICLAVISAGFHVSRRWGSPPCLLCSFC